jgi:hypothetical protein
MGHAGLVTTDHEDVGKLAVGLVEVDTGSAELDTVGEVGLRDLLDIRNLTGADINIDYKTALNKD